MHKVSSRMLYYADCGVLFLALMLDLPIRKVIGHVLKVIGRIFCSSLYKRF